MTAMTPKYQNFDIGNIVPLQIVKVGKLPKENQSIYLILIIGHKHNK